MSKSWPLRMISEPDAAADRKNSAGDHADEPAADGLADAGHARRAACRGSSTSRQIAHSLERNECATSSSLGLEAARAFDGVVEDRKDREQEHHQRLGREAEAHHRQDERDQRHHRRRVEHHDVVLERDAQQPHAREQQADAATPTTIARAEPGDEQTSSELASASPSTPLTRHTHRCAPACAVKRRAGTPAWCRRRRAARARRRALSAHGIRWRSADQPAPTGLIRSSAGQPDTRRSVGLRVHQLDARRHRQRGIGKARHRPPASRPGGCRRRASAPSMITSIFFCGRPVAVLRPEIHLDVFLRCAHLASSTLRPVGAAALRHACRHSSGRG